jgi:hypothetical protein
VSVRGRHGFKAPEVSTPERGIEAKRRMSQGEGSGRSLNSPPILRVDERDLDRPKTGQIGTDYRIGPKASKGIFQGEKKRRFREPLGGERGRSGEVSSYEEVR